ncbi:oxygen-dependent coproporphyrinogen oxidase [Corallococcus exiguus]|uniref:coproporphyrinogen oxidase n=1 Tax=Corallococcus exiguus TaxID=83462 RepID=A0A7X5BSS7_9BACT|nr:MULTISPECIES: oxygen-dependent coproporphyrinogen oxidase [Corallococcus]NBC42480.1 oxygen-dependent coproporphyrinogen oxidase [Corallococcus exiguus]NRD57043.1 oxygen-dependent coproporphyrinogen oxidase [Corallococcus exiguus]NRD65697.1 oxygen-dependent coproporphyrinogen oxidase [Corallococcus exiguus]RKH28746.1 oxygen-dependent coproporphyrinogen oxidase [Corallococcus sp. CA041A]RUO92799.1 oxygen-dependent coproporphyrinogen oxidase [Corallococcus sp. AB018]
MTATVDVEGLKGRMAAFIQKLQDDICGALEELDGQGRFREDAWSRPGGGGGRSRVLEDGAVLEKAGVNISIVHGELEEAFARKLQGEGRTFWAGGLSLVLHPKSPHVPTVHANYRFIHQGGRAWFGGGADLTPYYLDEADAAHFHRAHKAACDAHDPTYYPRFKAACDSYFHLRHRGEARGLGGIFFENMGGDLEREFAFVQACGNSFIPAYLPIARKHKDTPVTEEQRYWQEVRRGRYVEFNLVYDRGTIFGLETQGRTESILMSLPPRVRWRYDYHPEPGTPEGRLVEVLRNPREWA